MLAGAADDGTLLHAQAQLDGGERLELTAQRVESRQLAGLARQAHARLQLVLSRHQLRQLSLNLHDARLQSRL